MLYVHQIKKLKELPTADAIVLLFGLWMECPTAAVIQINE